MQPACTGVTVRLLRYAKTHGVPLPAEAPTGIKYLTAQELFTRCQCPGLVTPGSWYVCHVSHVPCMSQLEEVRNHL
jgi:hypothetical protein